MIPMYIHIQRRIFCTKLRWFLGTQTSNSVGNMLPCHTIQLQIHHYTLSDGCMLVKEGILRCFNFSAMVGEFLQSVCCLLPHVYGNLCQDTCNAFQYWHTSICGNHELGSLLKKHSTSVNLLYPIQARLSILLSFVSIGASSSLKHSQVWRTSKFSVRNHP